MAERLIALLAVLACAAPAAAQSGPLADPTRPADASSFMTSAGPQDAGAPAGPRLQSVLISPDRKLAIIDGETVALGGKLGDATLVRITETDVTLRRGAEVTTLELYPGVMRRAGRAGADSNKEDKP